MGDSKNSKINLARIRDNQRRSRARRKEYLQELEAKYRQCQQLGIEASAEVQAAARKVLEENKRLRMLLKHKGVSEAEINAFAVTPSGDHRSNTSGRHLNGLLGRKRSVPDVSTSSREWSPAPHDIRSTPITTASRPLVDMQHAGQRHASVSQPTSHRATSPYSNPSPMSASDAHSAYSQYPGTPSAEDLATDASVGSFPHLTYQYDLAPNAPWPMPMGNYHATPPPSSNPEVYNNASSCVYAANIIRGMRHDVGHELEANLGCTQPGTDCLVENTVVFDMMDRYASHPRSQ